MTTPLSGIVCIRMLGLAMMFCSPDLKSMLTHLEDTNGNAKCGNGVVWVGLGG